MAFPLLIPAATAAGAYVKGRWFSDDETEGKPNYMLTAGKVGLMGVGAYTVYRMVTKQLKAVTK